MIDKEFKKIKNDWSAKIMTKFGQPAAELFLRQFEILEAAVNAEIEKLNHSVSSLKEENSIVRDLIGASEIEIKSKLISQSEEIRFLQEQLLDFKKQISEKEKEIEEKLLEIEMLKKDKSVFEDTYNKEIKRLEKVIEDTQQKLQELDKSWNDKHTETIKELTSQRKIYQNKLNIASVEIWKFSYSVFSGWTTHLRDHMGAIFGATDYIHSLLSGTSSVKKMRKDIEPDLLLVREMTAKTIESFNRMAEFFSVQPEFKLSDINVVIKKLQAEFQKFHGIIINWPEEKEYPKIVMDEGLICEAFRELLKNSIDAIGPESRSGNIDFKIICDEINFTIEISDNGGGISPENQEKLFTPFFTTKPKRDGMGLVKAKRNILFHSGEISFEQSGDKPVFKIKLSHE